MNNMDSNLSVNGSELERVCEETQNLLSLFQETSNEFNQKLKELGNYWRGDDYTAMYNTVTQKVEPVIGVNGAIPTLMKDMIQDLEQKRSDYNSIQQKNVGYWG